MVHSVIKTATVIPLACILLACGSNTNSDVSGSLEVDDGTQSSSQVVKHVPKPKKVEKVSAKIVTGLPDSQKYGVGTTPTVTFNTPIPKKYRTDVADLISVTATKPIPNAAWVWRTPQTLTLRTQKYLPANTTLTVKTNLKDIPLWETKKTKYVGKTTTTRNIKIGRSYIVKINAKNHRLKIYKNGKQIRNFPTSLGKKGWETRSGTKTLMEKHSSIVMTSAAIGAPEYYRLNVKYALRLTPSGEFIHAAPWATGRLGNTNGSHGCTNLSTSAAKYMYDTYLPGDPVETKGTKKAMDTQNGPGAVWNNTWNTWVKHSTGKFNIPQQ